MLRFDCVEPTCRSESNHDRLAAEVFVWHHHDVASALGLGVLPWSFVLHGPMVGNYREISGIPIWKSLSETIILVYSVYSCGPCIPDSNWQIFSKRSAGFRLLFLLFGMAFLDGCNSASSASMMLLAAQLAAILQLTPFIVVLRIFTWSLPPFINSH